MLKLSFPTRKLKGSLIKITDKYKNFENKTLQAYGVTNKEGIVITGKNISDDTSNYTVITGKTFVYNPYRINVGSIGLTDDDFKGIVSPAYVAFKVKDDILPEFLLLYLKSSLGINLIKWYGDRGGVRSALRFNDLEKIDFPDLSYEQQEEALKNINKFIKIQNTLNQEMENQITYISKFRQSILQDAIQGKLVPQDPTDEPAPELLKKIKEEKEQTKMRIKYSCDYVEPLFHIPDSWTWCKFSNIIEHMEYGTSNKASEIRIGIPILRMNNIQNGRLDYSKLKYISSDTKDLPRLYLKKYDILFNRTNSYELVGKTALYEGNNDEYTFASYLIRVCLFKNYINPKYVTYYLNSQLFRKLQIEPLIIQQCGQANYSGDKLKNVLIPIPPKEEQARIVEKVDELMQLCDKLENENSNAQKFSSELLQSIMQKYFTLEV